jgi:predicted ferric reductase
VLISCWNRPDRAVPLRAILIWAALGAAVAVPLAVAATSPLLAWRDPVYIAGCLAGVVALALMLMQPLLAGGYLPGLPMPRGRRLHAWTGAGVLLAVVVHVGGLWLTSPPDVIDALLLTSPTLFSAWGVVAMWALLATAGLALMRWRKRIRPRLWRLWHSALAVVIVPGSVVHALLVDGLMGLGSKLVLCALVLAATAKALADLRVWVLLRRQQG